MLKKKTFLTIALVLGVMLAFSLMGCDTGTTGGGDGGGSGGGGGDQPGTVIPTAYRGVYDGVDNYEVNKNGGSVEIGILTLTENKITFNKDLGGSFGPTVEIFTNVSTGPDHVVTYYVYIGTWAYLYSGTEKIGIVWINQDGEREFATGSGATDWVAGFNLTVWGQGQSINLSDMPSNKHPLSGQDW
jgi:hypothetical protein